MQRCLFQGNDVDPITQLLVTVSSESESRHAEEYNTQLGSTGKREEKRSVIN
jgi:hypothetical protein